MRSGGAVVAIDEYNQELLINSSEVEILVDDYAEQMRYEWIETHAD